MTKCGEETIDFVLGGIAHICTLSSLPDLFLFESVSETKTLLSYVLDCFLALPGEGSGSVKTLLLMRSCLGFSPGVGSSYPPKMLLDGGALDLAGEATGGAPAPVPKISLDPPPGGLSTLQ